MTSQSHRILFIYSYKPGFAEASQINGITTLANMDSTTQSDIATLENFDVLPCANASSGSLKCEACAGGCQSLENIQNMTDELTHYVVPDGSADVILYRVSTSTSFCPITPGTPGTPVLNIFNDSVCPIKDVCCLIKAASVRPKGGNWSQAYYTNIGDDHANLNAGALPNGRVTFGVGGENWGGGEGG